MLYYKLNGYEDFKHRFGLESRNNGTTVRKNRILLGHLKNPLLLDYCVKQNDYTLLYVEDMADLQKKVAEAVRKSGMEDDRLSNEVELIGEVYRSARYRTDESKGICDDLDKNSVRYVNVERNRVFKMKSGKFMRELILETRWMSEFSHLGGGGNPTRSNLVLVTEKARNNPFDENELLLSEKRLKDLLA